MRALFIISIIIHAVALGTLTFTDPFFEIHCLKHGLFPSQVGSILSSAVAVIVVGLPIWSLCTDKCGKLFVLFSSLLTFIIATIWFGSSDTYLCWRLSRMLQGLGVSGISVASTRIALAQSGNVEINFGFMETVTGAVASVASAAGGFSYDLLGFRGSMFFISCISIVLLALLLCSKLSELRTVVFQRVISMDFIQSSVTNEPLKLTKIINGTIFIGGLSLFQAGLANCAVDPLLHVHLSLTSGASTALTGIVIMTYGIVYLVTAACIGYIPLSNKRLVQFGLLISFLSLTFLGPAPFFGLTNLGPKSMLLLTFICMTLLGVGQAIIATTVIALMSQSVQTEAGESSDSAISNVFLCTWYVGETVGYFCGGYLVQYAPNVAEVGCKEGHTGGMSCSSGWAWAMTYLGMFTSAVLVLHSIFVPYQVNIAAVSTEKKTFARKFKRKPKNKFHSIQTDPVVEVHYPEVTNYNSIDDGYTFDEDIDDAACGTSPSSRDADPNDKWAGGSNSGRPGPSLTRLASLSTVHVGTMVMERRGWLPRQATSAAPEGMVVQPPRLSFSLNDKEMMSMFTAGAPNAFKGDLSEGYVSSI